MSGQVIKSMILKRIFSILLYVCITTYLFVLSGCSQDEVKKGNQDLLVSAAASLKDTFTEIGELFESENSNVTITFNFGGSNILQKQIEQGAPIDVFASAAAITMDNLEDEKLIIKETRKSFASNKIVLIVPKNAGVKLSSFNDLTEDSVERIAIGSKEVPVRIYTEEVLRHLKLWDKLDYKFVYGNNVRQVLQYVARGEVEAGLVYSTDAASSKAVRVVAEAEGEWHSPIVYPIAVINDSKNKQASEKFIDFVMSPVGQGILRKYGFAVPQVDS